MFGMKDYRAAKLYWLLSRPLNWFWFLAFPVAAFLLPIIVSAFIHQDLWLQIPLQIVISYVVVELLAIPALLSGFIFDKFFYFIIDVEPSLGKNETEAKRVLQGGGELFKLVQKMETHIEEWDTFDDTDRYYQLAFNWRQKLFFRDVTKARLRKTIDLLARNYHKNGTQPTKAVIDEVAKELATELKQPILEKTICTATSWNTIVRLFIIVITTLYVH